MSLIHEALRKARHEAARGDDPGVIYPGGLTGRRPRRGLAVGILAGMALTIALATVIGGTLWWVLRQSPSDRPARAGPGRSTAQPLLPQDGANPPADEILIEEPALSAAAEPPVGAAGEPSETEPAGIATDPGITERHRPNSEPADRTVTFATQPTRAPDPSAVDPRVRRRRRSWLRQPVAGLHRLSPERSLRSDQRLRRTGGQPHRGLRGGGDHCRCGPSARRAGTAGAAGGVTANGQGFKVES